MNSIYSLTPKRNLLLPTSLPANKFSFAGNLKWLLTIVTFLVSFSGFSQISGTKTVGAGEFYGTLTAAFADIQTQTLNGNITLQLTSNYDATLEPGFPINAPSSASIGVNLVSVYPTASGLSIFGNSTTGILNLSGTNNITIDGRVNATGTTRDLVIYNNDITTGYTVQFANNAVSNTLNYCSVRGGATVASGVSTSGVILFSTATSTGNSNNTISNCDIRDAGNGFPQIAINSIGTAAFPNANNTITNNNIVNFFHATLASRGIDLGVGNTGWSIIGNNFFQNSTRTSTATATATQTGINISSTAGSGYTITDNYIGGNTINAGGAWTVAGAGLYRFFGMNIVAASSPASNIQNNVIKNFNISTNVNANPVFAGILVQNGSFNIGTVFGNTIGLPTGTGSVTITMGGSAATVTTALQAFGIWMTGTVAASTYNVSNNLIGSFTLDAATINHALGFEGIIASAGSATAINITNNTVGSTVTANSINSPTLSVTGAQLLRGIDVQNTITGGNINVAINGNIVANMNQNSTLYSVSTGGTGANIRGIVCSPAAASGTVTVNSNQVYNISGAGATAPSFSSQGSEAGIVMFATGTNNITIQDNEIHDISGTNNGATYYAVAGIVGSNATSARFLRNKIYNLSNASTINSSTTPPIAAGFWFGASGGDYTYVNNMVTLGTGQTTNTMFCGFISSGNSGATRYLFYNTFKITGSAAAGALPSWGILRTASLAVAFGAAASAGGSAINIKNNFIDNDRNGGTGKHYALGNISASGSTGWGSTASNFNILNSTSPSAMAGWGVNPGTDYTLATFRTLTGGDASSLTGVAATFYDAANGDLHINMGVTGNQIESTGTPIVTPTFPVAYTTDYDNQVRPGGGGVTNGGGTFPDIGADEFDGKILDITAPTISYTPLNNTSLTGGETLNGFATITDLGGVNGVMGTRPRLYYRRSTDGTSFGDNTNATPGWKYDEANGAGSPFTFTIDYTKLSGGTGVTTGTIIEYFVVAQDLANPNPNIAINSGTFFTAPTSVDLLPANFPISGAIKSYTIVPAYVGSINVGTSETITSLTNANGLFDKINNGALTGDLTVNITSDLTAETGVIGLNQFAEDGVLSGLGYYLTIKPTGAARLISGTPSTPSLIKFSGTDKVILNGSLTTNGTDRSLTIQNMSQDYDLGNIPDNCVIHVSSPVSGNGANYNTIKNCIIRGLSNVGTEYGIAMGGSDAGGDPGSGALAPSSNNTYQNNFIYASNFGVFFNGSSASPDLNNIITGNIIGSPVNSLKTYFAGFWSQGESNMQITDNNILGVSGDLSGAFAICGIFINSSSANLLVTGNNITDINNTSTTGGATGIRLGAFGTASTNMLIANNTISDVFCPGTNAVPTEVNNGSGMIVLTSSGLTTNAYKIYNNSVNLNTNQTGGNAAAFVVAAGVTIAGVLDVRNNSFATSQTSGTRYAIYVASPSTVFSNINRNDYYTTAGGTLGFLTSARTTLAAWQSATGQDANSLNADPKYNTAIVLGPLAGSPLIAAGVPLAGVIKDQIGITRSVTTPSIGAYELAGDYAAPIITYTPLPYTCATGNVTLTAGISDVSGVNTFTATKPRIYFNKNNGTFFSAPGTQIGGSIVNGTWTFTINATTLGGLTVGDKVYYFVVAQDIAPNANLGTRPTGGFGADVNSITAYPPAYDSFSVSTILNTGTYTVGAGGNYTTLTAAINDYNTKCLNGPVTFALLNASYSTGTGETMPLTIRANPYASSTNMLTIKPNTGVTSTITGAGTSVIISNGADYVTIDGSNNGTNTRNLTLSGTSTTSGARVFYLLSLGAGAGATYNTIKNCIMQCGSTGTGANAGTVSTFYNVFSADVNAAPGVDNDNFTLDNNVFKLASIGVFASANATGYLNNWSITNNTFGDNNNSFTLRRTGLSVDFTNNITISGNTFMNINTTDLGSATGISLGTEVSNATIRKNVFSDIKYSSTGSFGGRAISLNTGLAASNIVIDNNSITNISGAGSNNLSTDAIAGIRVLGTTGGVKIYYNSINLGTGTIAGNSNGIVSAAAFFAAAVTGIDLRNNILYSNINNTGSGTHRTYAIYSEAPSSAFTTINYNDYAVGGAQGILGFIGSNRTTLANIVTGFGGNAKSISVVPAFTSATDLHLTASGNCGIDNKGQVISGFSTDYDGNTRDIFYTDMGFDEFTSSDNQWIGAVSTSWLNTANWCSGTIPLPTTDVTIPAGTPFQPVLISNASIRNLTVQTGATVGLSSFMMTIAGTLSGTGTLVGTSASKLELTGNGALGTLYVGTPNSIGSVTMSGTGASITLGTPLNVYGTLDVKGNTLTTGGNLTIKSDINGTGSVAAITGGGTISGSVTVERYIPQNAFRAWRLLAVPVQGTQTFKQAWQEGQTGLTNTVPGFGTLLTSIAGTNGYDAATTGNSLLSFVNGTPGSFTPVSNTNNAMATTSGYYVYIRGNRGTQPSGGVFNTTATTLRTQGSLYQGNQTTITLPAGQNVLVGNVYASAIDFATLVKSGVSSFRVWDPKIAGTSNTGAYQSFSASNGYDPTPGGGSYGSIANSRIESGLAFMLNSATGGSVQLTEAAKVTGSKNVFKPSAPVRQLKTNLYAVKSNGNELADGNAVVFRGDFSNGLDEADLIKSTNMGENFGVVNAGKEMVIDARKGLLEADMIQFSMSNLKTHEYALEFIPQNLVIGEDAFLRDNFEGTLTPISLSANSIYKFTVTSDNKSSLKDRFSIVFGTSAGTLSYTAVKAVKTQANVEVNWKVSAERNINTYEVEHSTDGIHFASFTTVSAKGNSLSETNYSIFHSDAKAGENFYRIKSIARNGNVTYSKAVTVNWSNTKSIAVYPNPVFDGNLNIKVYGAEGLYNASLINKAGQIVYRFTFSNNGEGTGVKTTKFPSSISAGVYDLNIVSPDGKVVKQSIVISSK